MRTCPFSLINYKYQCHLARLGKFCKLRNHLFFPFFSPSPLEWAVTSIWLKNKKPTSYRNFLCLKVFLNNNFYFWKNTLATTFCSTVTSLTCCFSSLFPAEKNWYAENLTWVVEQPILPLPTRYCPCPPIPSQTPILSRFFLFSTIVQEGKACTVWQLKWTISRVQLSKFSWSCCWISDEGGIE